MNTQEQNPKQSQQSFEAYRESSLKESSAYFGPLPCEGNSFALDAFKTYRKGTFQPFIPMD